MNKLKKLSTLFLLPAAFAWFLATLFVDIVAVPSVFRNVSSLMEAGKVGMMVFGTFNKVEFLLAFLIGVGVVNHYKKNKKLSFVFLAVFLSAWALMYNFYFTPHIIHFTNLINNSVPGSELYLRYQSEHAFYHTAYRYLDSTKLLLLLSFMGVIIKEELT